MTPMHRLYGSPISLYTGKVRAYFVHKGIPFEEVMSSWRVYQSIIMPQTGVAMIPVVETPEEEYLQDSTHIIDTLEARFQSHAVYPDTPCLRLASLLLELYGDEWLLLPAMHYRWNTDQRPFVYSEFGKTVLPGWPRLIQQWFGKKVGSKFNAYVPRLGITQETTGALEAWYEGFLGTLDAHFADHDYLLGGRPSIGDFGFMGPLYAHLYRDPVPGKLMQQTAPRVARWVERMNDTEGSSGGWCKDDEVPPSLDPIFHMLFTDYWPVITDTVQRLHQWHTNHPDTTHIPRVIGEHRFSLGQAQGMRVVLPYGIWMLQRVIDFYRQLDDTTQVDAWLRRVGGHEALQLDIPTRVTRVNNRLHIAD